MRWEDETAFEVFVDETATRLLRVAFLLVEDRARAELLVQRALRHTARRWNRVGDPTLHALGVITRSAARTSALTPRRQSVLVLAFHEQLAPEAVARVLHMGRLEVESHLAHVDPDVMGRSLRDRTRFVRIGPETTWSALQGARRPSLLMAGR
jgi:hypothetical protein